MCGIFGYLNYNTQVDSSEVVQRLLTGLRRLEYRGYDSAGVAFDTTRHEDDDEDLVVVVKECGNIDRLSARVERTMRERGEEIDFKAVKQTGHCAIAHTRWATHGVPSEANSHPQLARSQGSGLVEWCVVHNGISTNYRPLKDFLSSRGLLFESDTDTEVIPKLCKYVWDGYDDAQRGEVSFREVVSQVVGELEGALPSSSSQPTFRASWWVASAGPRCCWAYGRGGAVTTWAGPVGGRRSRRVLGSA